MIDAGLPLVQCLEILSNDPENPSMSTLLKKSVQMLKKVQPLLTPYANIRNILIIFL